MSDLDTRIEQTAAAIMPWCIEADLFGGLDPSRRVATAEVIATFACLCAPTDPSPAGTLLAARLTAIFAYLDDLPKSELSGCVEKMLEVVRGRRSAPHERPQVAAFSAYLRELADYGDVTYFCRQFETFLLALLEEAELVARGSLTMASYQDIRHRVIFVEEYIWTWLLSERLPVDANALERTVRLRRLASEVVYLVNDIGSLERDRATDGGDPNLVLLIEREQGKTEDEALDAVIRLHNEKAIAYAAELDSVCAGTTTPATRAIASIVNDAVVGNLGTTKRLSKTRYPGAHRALEQLHAYPLRAQLS